VKRNRLVGVAAVTGFLSILLATLSACTHSTMPSARQTVVEQRSEMVMPFDLDRTMHVFTPTQSGGMQTVMVRDGDPRQIALVRSHLRKEASAFAHGDFADPASIHGNDMPGLAKLRAGAHRIVISYADTANGASITYKTSDPALITAIHDWFAAQLSDHAAHAMMGH
jgi:hypothetical protein